MMINQENLQQQLLHWHNLIQLNPYQAKLYLQRGMVQFKLAKITESIADFDEAEKLQPSLTPYLWQRGLSYYYAQRYQEGAKQFEIDLTVNSQDVEETVWRYLCTARFQGVTEARNSLLVVKNDPRPILRKIYELYEEKVSVEEVLKTGKETGNRGNFYSHLYVGLYYEAQGNQAKAQEFIVKAATDYPLEDYMWYLACVHQQLSLDNL